MLVHSLAKLAKKIVNFRVLMESNVAIMLTKKMLKSNELQLT